MLSISVKEKHYGVWEMFITRQKIIFLTLDLVLIFVAAVLFSSSSPSLRKHSLVVSRNLTRSPSYSRLLQCSPSWYEPFLKYENSILGAFYLSNLLCVLYHITLLYFRYLSYASWSCRGIFLNSSFLKPHDSALS